MNAQSDPARTMLFDLTELSAANYRRHRPWQFACVGVGVGLSAGLLLFGWYSIATEIVGIPSWENWLALASLGLIGAVILWVLWAPIRLLARPPIAISISDTSVEFALRDGARLLYGWSDPLLWGGVLVREGDPRVPDASRYRLLLGRRGSDLRRPWRRIAPPAYLTKVGAEEVMEAARRAGWTVTAFKQHRVMALIYSKSGIGYDFSRSPWS